MAAQCAKPSRESSVASIAAMSKTMRSTLLAALVAAASAVLLGCGGDNGPAPSIPAANAQILENKIAEVNANVQVGSCLVAASKTDELLADINDLPSGVNQDVRNALENGANNLKLLLNDPAQCQPRSETTTSTPSTTESTTESTTTRTQPTTTIRTQTQPTTPTQTQTTPTPTTGGSGGIGPGGL
jgi:hypothetical protein